MAFVHVLYLSDPLKVVSYWNALLLMPEVFFGVERPRGYRNAVVAGVFALRLFFFGLLMSTLIRWFSRR